MSVCLLHVLNTSISNKGETTELPVCLSSQVLITTIRNKDEQNCLSVYLPQVLITPSNKDETVEMTTTTTNKLTGQRKLSTKHLSRAPRQTHTHTSITTTYPRPLWSPLRASHPWWRTADAGQHWRSGCRSDGGPARRCPGEKSRQQPMLGPR